MAVSPGPEAGQGLRERKMSRGPDRTGKRTLRRKGRGDEAARQRTEKREGSEEKSSGVRACQGRRMKHRREKGPRLKEAA